PCTIRHCLNSTEGRPPPSWRRMTCICVQESPGVEIHNGIVSCHEVVTQGVLLEQPAEMGQNYPRRRYGASFHRAKWGEGVAAGQGAGMQERALLRHRDRSCRTVATGVSNDET